MPTKLGLSLTWARPKNLCIQFCIGVRVDPKPVNIMKHNPGMGEIAWLLKFAA